MTTANSFISFLKCLKDDSNFTDNDITKLLQTLVPPTLDRSMYEFITFEDGSEIAILKCGQSAYPLKNEIIDHADGVQLEP